MDTPDTTWPASDLIVLDFPVIASTELCFDRWPELLEALVDWLVYVN
jgi:hypothetical protein